MKIRIKICAAITALTIFCAALLTACGGAPRPTFLYENPTDGVTATAPRDDDETTHDGSLVDAVEPPDVYDDAPGAQPPDTAPAENETDPAENVDSDASVPAPPTSANVVTVTYSSTQGGYVRGETTQTVEVGAYTEEVTAVANPSYKWWKFVKWSDGVTTPTRSDKAVKSFTVTAVFEQEGEPDGDFRFRLLPDGSGYEVIAENNKIKEVRVPAYYKGLPVKEIADSAFNGCYDMTYLYIPETVVKLGNRFCHSDYLKRVDGMVNVKELGSYAFNSCNSLERVTGLQRVEILGTRPFDYCDNLEYVIFSDTIDKLNSYAFIENDPENNRVVFIRKTQSEMQKMNIRWFLNVRSESKCKCVYIGTEGKPSDEYALKEYDELYDFTPTGDGSGYKVRLKDAGVTEAIIPSHYNGLPVTEITERGFADSGVITAYIPYTVNKIGNYAFSNCKSLVRIAGMDEATSIGDGAFADCEKLNGLILPSTLNNVGAQILRNNDSRVYTRSQPSELTELNPDWDKGRAPMAGATYIADGMPDERFELIYYDIEITGYHSAIGVAALDTDIGQAEIPYQFSGYIVRAVVAGGFADCAKLERVFITSAYMLSEIRAEAFSGCIKLKAIYGTKNVRTVGTKAFANCPELERLILSSNVVIEN